MEIASSAQSLIVMSAILPTPARPVLMATSTKINNASSVTQTVRSVQAMLRLALYVKTRMSIIRVPVLPVDPSARYARFTRQLLGSWPES